jgi:hypothetical protein
MIETILRILLQSLKKNWYELFSFSSFTKLKKEIRKPFILTKFVICKINGFYKYVGIIPIDLPLNILQFELYL